MNLNKLSITQAHQGLIKKEFTSQELTEAVFDAIKKKDKDIHAY